MRGLTADVKGIFPPDGGWEPRTFYIVEVSYFSNNVVHDAIFFTGYLDDEGNPSGYNKIVTSTGNKQISKAYYLRVKEKLAYYVGGEILSIKKERK